MQQQPRKRAELEYRAEIMQAVQATLEWLYVHEAEVRAWVEERAAALDRLPLISKEEGLRMRDGQAEKS